MVLRPPRLGGKQSTLDRAARNFKSAPERIARLSRAPFIGVLDDQQSLEDAMARLEASLARERAHP